MDDTKILAKMINKLFKAKYLTPKQAMYLSYHYTGGADLESLTMEFDYFVADLGPDAKMPLSGYKFVIPPEEAAEAEAIFVKIRGQIK